MQTFKKSNFVSSSPLTHLSGQQKYFFFTVTVKQAYQLYLNSFTHKELVSIVVSDNISFVLLIGLIN
jgi:hypothetical protein